MLYGEKNQTRKDRWKLRVCLSSNFRKREYFHREGFEWPYRDSWKSELSVNLWEERSRTCEQDIQMCFERAPWLFASVKILEMHFIVFSMLFSCRAFIFSFIFISWRLITLQHCSGFCHTLKWISQGFTCIPHPGPPSHLPLHSHVEHF